ncbi:MAG: helix-turn-helix domain-containing protein [Saprospiraceae bacterium]|nr:helix-turn-helix domain-containing protein [Saprospiraceae bacterium]
MPIATYWTSIVALGLLLFPGRALHAQQYERLTVDDGLSQGFVRSIIQTRDGFMWFATLDGLNRYDGNSFKVYRNNPQNPNSLNSDFVLELLEDSRGVLWVITDRGPNLFDPATGNFYQPEISKNLSFSGSNPLRNFREDHLGRLWALTSTQLVRFDIPHDALTPEQMARNAKILVDFVTEQRLGELYNLCPVGDELWLLAENGNVRYGFNTGNFQALPDYVPSNPLLILHRYLTGETWITHPEGITYCYQGKITRLESPDKTQYWSRAVLNDQGLYFLSSTKICRWQDDKLYELYPVIPERILSASTDRNGILWIGTDAQGIYKVYTGRIHFNSFQEGVSHARPPLEDSRGRIWIARSGFSLTSYYELDVSETGGLNPVPLYRDHFSSVIHSKKGGFWAIGSGRRICYLSEAGSKSTCVQSDKYYSFHVSFIEDHRGRICATTSDGQLVIYDPATNAWMDWSFIDLQEGNSAPFVSAIVEDNRGHLWLGSTNGLLEAVPDENGTNFQFKRYDIRNGLSRDRILSLAIDPAHPDWLWIGTQHGLNRLEFSTGKIETLSLRDGLPNDVIYSIVVTNDSNLWAGTNAGLLRINHKSRRWQHFTTADGLPCSEFNTGVATRLKDGRLLFGGVNGITLFNPDEVNISSNRPGIVITEMLVNSKPYTINPSAPVSLGYDENYLIFQFALLDFLHPSSNRYQYRLLGVSDIWSPLSSEHSVAFSHLKPGRYQLEVRGVNSEGVESPTAHFSFQIKPPWWQSFWACLAYGIILLISGRIFYQWKKQQRAFKKKREAERQEAERIKELDQFKSRLYANITHEFRTPLTVILGTAGQMSKNANPEQARPLDMIARNGEQLLRLVNQMLDWSKLESSHLRLQVRRFDLIAFLHLCAEPFRTLTEAKKLNFDLRLPDAALMVESDPDRLHDIVANLLSNAVKFTPSGGSVTLRLDLVDSDTLCISVEDTGIGIPPEHIHRVFERFYQVRTDEKDTDGSGIGLAYANELAQIMNGRLEAGSQPGEGTTLRLYLSQHNTLAFTPAEKSIARRPTTPEPVIIAATDPSLPLVLLVEDNPDVAQYTASCLLGRYQVIYAENGETGVKKALEATPDLIISDVMMPAMDGYELCRTLKSDPRTSHIPVILLTARVDEVSQVQGYQFGADVYLKKPFNQESLLLQMDNLMRLRSSIQDKITAGLLAEEHTATPPPSSGLSGQEIFVRNVLELIEANYNNPDYGVSDMQKTLLMSSTQLHRKLTALTGRSPGQLLRRHRLEKARQLLVERSDLTVAEIAYRVGYKDPNYFFRAFREEFDVPPNTYRKGFA